jgi:hypothetical protein
MYLRTVLQNILFQNEGTSNCIFPEVRKTRKRKRKGRGGGGGKATPPPPKKKKKKKNPLRWTMKKEAVHFE